MRTRFRQIPKFTGALRFIVGNMTKRELRRAVKECQMLKFQRYSDGLTVSLSGPLKAECEMEIRRRDRRFKSPPLFPSA